MKTLSQLQEGEIFKYQGKEYTVLKQAGKVTEVTSIYGVKETLPSDVQVEVVEMLQG